MRVYFVDDDETTLFLYQLLGKKMELDASYCKNGEEFINTIKVEEKAVVFLDLNMPVLDGKGVLKHLQDNGFPNCRVVLMMGGELPSDVTAEIKALGCNDFCKKPLKAEDVSSYLN